MDSFYRGMLLLVAATSPVRWPFGTPAVLARIAQAARHGVLIEGDVTEENLGHVQVMAFDKTGTLSGGTLQITDIVLLRTVQVKNRCCGWRGRSAAIPTIRWRRRWCGRSSGLPRRRQRSSRIQQRARECRGEDGACRFEGVSMGRTAHPWMQTPPPRSTNSSGRARVPCSSPSNGHRGLLALAIGRRPGVAGVLEPLGDLGVRKLVMLTGDNPQAAQQIGAEVGVTDVRAGAAARRTSLPPSRSWRASTGRWQ